MQDISAFDREDIRVMLTTQDYIVMGNIYMPSDNMIDYPSVENILFYTLNCGNKFIALKDVTISSREKPEYQPEYIEYYNINLDIVHSCKIVEKE